MLIVVSVTLSAALGAVVRLGKDVATSACATRTFQMTFDPKNSATVASGQRLATVTFSSRWLSMGGSCHRVAEPRVYRDVRLIETHRAGTMTCRSSRPIKIHVNAIINGDSTAKKPIGNTVVIGFGEPLTVIASAVLKNKGDPLATSLYRSRRYCVLGR